MNNPSITPTTPESPMLPTPQQLEDIEFEKRRIAFLDSALAALPDSRRTALVSNLSQTVNETVHELRRKLRKTREIQEPAAGPIKVRIYLMNSEEAKWHDGRENVFIASGTANHETNTIALLNHLTLAPKEVVRRVTTHEILHLLYRFSSKPELPVRKTVKSAYPPECHQEEEWVRRMEEHFCGKLNHHLAWEAAVEKAGADWRDTYYRIKKSPNLPRDDEY